MREAREKAAGPRRSPVEAHLTGALAQVDSVLLSVKDLRIWDPEGWRMLRCACFDLQDLLRAKLEEAQSSSHLGESAPVIPSREISEALARVRIHLDRLSLPKAAWEGWWTTVCRLKTLEARLERGRSSLRSAVA